MPPVRLRRDALRRPPGGGRGRRRPRAPQRVEPDPRGGRGAAGDAGRAGGRARPRRGVEPGALPPPSGAGLAHGDRRRRHVRGAPAGDPGDAAPAALVRPAPGGLLGRGRGRDPGRHDPDPLRLPRERLLRGAPHADGRWVCASRTRAAAGSAASPARSSRPRWARRCSARCCSLGTSCPSTEPDSCWRWAGTPSDASCSRGCAKSAGRSGSAWGRCSGPRSCWSRRAPCFSGPARSAPRARARWSPSTPARACSRTSWPRLSCWRRSCCSSASSDAGCWRRCSRPSPGPEQALVLRAVVPPEGAVEGYDARMFLRDQASGVQISGSPFQLTPQPVEDGAQPFETLIQIPEGEYDVTCVVSHPDAPPARQGACSGELAQAGLVVSFPGRRGHPAGPPRRRSLLRASRPCLRDRHGQPLDRRLRRRFGAVPRGRRPRPRGDPPQGGPGARGPRRSPLPA